MLKQKKGEKMSKKAFILPLALALATAVVGFSEGEQVQSYDQGHAIKEKQIPSAYNHPARIDVNDSWDVFITGSFIYWQGIEGGLDLGHYYYTSQTAENPGAVVEMNFKYKPGFKVALGTNLGHDNWILSAEYTWLHFSDTKSYADYLDTINIAEGWNYDDSCYLLYAKWKFRYDMIDLEMARPYYLGTCLVFKPFVALRGGWIKQFYNWYGATVAVSEETDYGLSTLPTAYDFANNLQKTWLVGPRVGVNCDWIFFDDFRLIGNAAAALFYQNFNLTSDVGYYVEDTKYYGRILTDKNGQLTPNVEGALGLGWGSYFGSNNGWHFDLSLLYEVHYFWNQNKMRALNERMVQELITDDATGESSYVYSPSYKAEDLMLHGLTVTVRFDF
jgi:hypothetical protein